MLTDSQIKKLVKKRADLKIQSMLFDMDIDWETLALAPKRKDTIPFWARKYREQRHQSDLDEYFDMDRSE